MPLSSALRGLELLPGVQVAALAHNHRICASTSDAKVLAPVVDNLCRVADHWRKQQGTAPRKTLIMQFERGVIVARWLAPDILLLIIANSLLGMTDLEPRMRAVEGELSLAVTAALAATPEQAEVVTENSVETDDDQTRLYRRGGRDTRRHDSALARIGPLQRELDPGAKRFHPGAKRFHHPYASVAGICLPADYCGGDWWSLTRLDDHRLLVIVGDATGHDLRASFVIAAARAAFDTTLFLRGSRVSCTDLLRAMNHAVRQCAGGQLQMTCVAVMLDQQTHTLQVVGASHPAPLLIRRGPAGPAVTAFPTRGSPLGAVLEPSLSSSECRLQPGDELFLFSDGVTECEDPRGRRFGIRRLTQMLVESERAALPGLCLGVERSLARFRGTSPPRDDATFVGVRVAPDRSDQLSSSSG